MRIGAIFARGSCRALKRMALFGVVFALGAAQAAAQVTVTTPKTVDEGGRLTLSVSAKISVGPGLAAPTSITITPTVAARSAVSAGDEASLTAAEVAAGLTVADAADFDAPVPAALALVVQPHPTGGTADAVNRTLTGTITVQTRPDLDAEDEGIQVTYAVVNADAVNVTAQGGAALALDADSTGAQKVTISDTDDQVFEWKLTTDSPKESGAVNVTLTADPTPVDRLHVTAISVDKAGYTVDTSSHTFGNEVDAGSGDDGPMASIAITPPNPDGDRDTDTITLRALMGGTNIDRATPLEIEVADIHGLPMADKITATAFTIDDMDKKTEDKAMSIMEGGDPVYVTVTVDRGEMGYPSGEALAVSVTADPSQALDYRVDPPEVTIASGTGKKSADFMLWAAADDDVGMEDLMLYLTAKGATAKNGSGEVMGMFSIAIEDATTPLVSVKDGAYDAIMTALGDDPLNPGDEVMIMTDDLFMYDADMVSVSFGTSVEGASVGASASGEAVTVTAMEPGEAEVTVSATATPRSSSLVVTQERANVARLTFPVSVVMSELSVAVTADPTEIMEGGTSTITATASREVAASDGEVVVGLEVVGDGELSAASITIEAGSTTGTATVTATEDDDDYEDETLTVIARGAGEATLTIMVTDNDEAPVPPEPTNLVTAKSSDEIYPLLMAAGLAGDDAMFHPGDVAELDAGMMFEAAESVSVGYAAESDDMMVAGTATSGTAVSIMAGAAGMAHVTVTATAIMPDGVMTGQPATNVATVTFPVNVVNMPLAVTVSADPMDMVEEGGMITVTAMANRAVLADEEAMVTLTITGAVEMNEATIEIAAGMESGTAMVQVLDDMEVAPMADITIVATGSGIATPQTFTISVTENDSPRTFTLSGPDDMNLVEGMEYELTVMADPAVSADTEVMIMRDRSASTADDSDYLVESITIMAGEASGSTMLTVTEDGTDDSGAHMNEVLVLFAVADNTQSNSLEFNLWDAAVPALPVIAQLLLAAFLAIGGYRRYLRR